MEWLEFFKIGQLSTGEYAFLMWFFGAVGGYCFGRLHAVWIQMGKLSNQINATVERLNKGAK